MINNNKVRNTQVPFKPIEGLATGETLGKIRLKNIYTSWNGESVFDIKAKHDTNPYLVRIGTPNTDDKLRSDNIYFISHYLAYNPITQHLEDKSVSNIITKLIDRVDQLTKEVVQLKAKVKTQPIYTKDSL